MRVRKRRRTRFIQESSEPKQTNSNGSTEDQNTQQEAPHHKSSNRFLELSKKQLYTIYVGFFGGLFASFLTYMIHFLNFIPFGPGVIWHHVPYLANVKWLQGVWGHLAAIVFISFFSILISYLYYALFRKIETPWMSIWFGLTLWAILFVGINSLVSDAQNVYELGWTTNIAFICIFIIYGLFIGYSISYQYLSDSTEKKRATNS